MGQTLYAIAALMAATSFSYTVLQRQVHMQRNSMAREVEEMASAVALEALEVIRARPFDEKEVECAKKKANNGVGTCKVTGKPNDISQFTYHTNSQQFPGGKQCHSSGLSSAGEWEQQWLDACDDVDDYHEMVPAVVQMPMGAEDTTIEFQVEAEVEYVKPTAGATAEFVHTPYATAYKRVIVKVQDSLNGNVGVFIPEPVTISRVVAYNYNPAN